MKLSSAIAHRNIVIVGNPNAGKTLLFNRLTGLQAKTANYPGVTVDFREATAKLAGESFQIIDLPGLYSLDAISPEEQITRDFLTGAANAEITSPDLVLLVLDATNLRRNLFLASQVLELSLPVVVAVNVIDVARSRGIDVDIDSLSSRLQCPVVAVSAKTGEGIRKLKEQLVKATRSEELISEPLPSCTSGCKGCHFAARHDWAQKVICDSTSKVSSTSTVPFEMDRLLTHPVFGVVTFVLLMLFVFYMIFSFATLPMNLIDGAFTALGGWLREVIPSTKSRPAVWFGVVMMCATVCGLLICYAARIRFTTFRTLVLLAVATTVSLLPAKELQSLLADGVVTGVGGMLVFLPQICILFFFISLLEDSGYMARAAFVMERIMRCVGLPGKAFVPMLSAHACAIPGIMSARVIENWRDRLTTILVLPLLTCSARLPVYAMIASLLFLGSAMKAALVFVGAYLLGITAALCSAWLLKRTILPGEAIPLVIELPEIRWPSLRNALLTLVDRAIIFIRQAGTIILLISVFLWVLASYPQLPEKDAANILLQHSGENTAAQRLAQAEIEYSAAGRVGRFVEPVFAPLGFDWQINIGVMTSFAAREVVVSTLAIVYGIGEDAAENKTTLIETLRRQKRPNGSPVFTTATSVSFLVFFVLAMQCLPTQAVTRRETGSWKWAILQFTFMSCLAYLASLATYQLCCLWGLG